MSPKKYVPSFLFSAEGHEISACKFCPYCEELSPTVNICEHDMEPDQIFVDISKEIPEDCPLEDSV